MADKTTDEGVDNPYESPGESVYQQIEQAAGSQFIHSDGLTKCVVWALYAQVVVAVISIISGFMEYQLLTDYERGVYASQDEAVADGEANDRRQMVIAIGYGAVFIISGFLILKWVYRANYNARQLGAVGMKFTPGWSVGWYFIPIMSLWKPFQAMREIWQVSHNPKDWQSVEAGSILGAWWAFFLINGWLGRVVYNQSNRAEEIAEFKQAASLSLASDVVGIILALVTLLLVNKIYRAQIDQYNRLFSTP
ncbi:DUF4328 domain-containing protein [Cardiobacteriales bacterium ML27]|uniref:DUF4328 domain-containing protein n=2 Tax=Ostreibacterium oceani TaxID=2654998 RepID=A0A6N7EV01_9GAMM|nr:DUF4328 domain-containing protein [Ostreibacterium oceani]